MRPAGVLQHPNSVSNPTSRVPITTTGPVRSNGPDPGIAGVLQQNAVHCHPGRHIGVFFQQTG